MNIVKTATLAAALALALAGAGAWWFASRDAAPEAPLSGAESAADEAGQASVKPVIEDAVAAMDAVRDETDGNLVASRLAVDFILLEKIRSRTLGSGETDARFAEAAKAATDAASRLTARNCHDSRALAAAVRLGDALLRPLQPVEAAEAASELATNNQEMIVQLLAVVANRPTADAAAPLVQAALAYGEVLDQYLARYAAAPLDAEKKEEFARRQADAELDLRDCVGALLEADFYGSPALRGLFGGEREAQGAAE